MKLFLFVWWIQMQISFYAVFQLSTCYLVSQKNSFLNCCSDKKWSAPEFEFISNQGLIAVSLKIHSDKWQLQITKCYLPHFTFLSTLGNSKRDFSSEHLIWENIKNFISWHRIILAISKRTLLFELPVNNEHLLYTGWQKRSEKK